MLEIDRSFIENVTCNADDRAITQTILAMASSLGLPAVAEGMETVEQRDLLQHLGCRTAQGYLFARPRPAVGLFSGGGVAC